MIRRAFNFSRNNRLRVLALFLSISGVFSFRSLPVLQGALEKMPQ
jgi:hypothetical protein